MNWQIDFHPLVLSEDLPLLDRNVRDTIMRAIEHKLTRAPEHFGAPLRTPFINFWKLRVGAYRVIYSMGKQHLIIHIITIGARRNDAV